MNEVAIKVIANIFTGKGSGLKFAMVGLVILGLASLITDSNYEFEACTSDGKKVSLKPHEKECDNVSDTDSLDNVSEEKSFANNEGRIA